MIGVNARVAQSQIDWRYLGREAILILLFAWALPIAGGMDGLISFRGQTGSALLFTVVAGTWLAHGLWARRRLPMTGLEFPLIVFVVVQGASAALSDVPRLSLPAIAQTLAYVLLFYLAIDLTRTGWPAELLEKCLLIGGVIVLALAALDLGTAFQGWLSLLDLPYAPPFEHRLYAVVGDANILAGFTNVIWPLALSRLVMSRSTVTRLMLGAVIALALVVQAYCYSRGATLALALGGLVFAAAWVGLVSDRLRQQVVQLWRWLVANPIWLVILCLAGAVVGAALGWRLLVSRNNATQAPATEARTQFWGVAMDAFQAKPWLGIGPGAFPQTMSTAISAPPEHLFMNAHSLIFNTLAENGGLGLTAAVVLLGAFVWGFWRARITTTVEARARWAATAAAWTAFLAHGLVDYHVRYLAVAVPLLVSAALVFASRTPETSRRAPRQWPVWVLAPFGLLICAFSLYQLTAAFRFEQATLAGREEDWERAAERADQATEMDAAFGLYPAQAGYAYARLSLDTATDRDVTAAYRDTAIARYVTALERMPGNAIWELNLAVLLEGDGDLSAALHHLDLAQSAAPGWGAPALLRALWQEDAAEVTARSAYADALTREPRLASAALWAATPLRRGVLAQWQAIQTSTADSLDAQLQQLLADGRLAEAQQLLDQAREMSPSSPWIYRSLAALAAAQGAPTLASRYLQAAEWLQSVDMRDRVAGAVQAGQLALSVGDRNGGARAFNFAWDGAAQVSPYGWGYLGYVPTAHFIFQRDPWAAELVPQMPQIDFDAGLARTFGALNDMDSAVAPATPEMLHLHTLGAINP